jgi:hypothetical protein
MDDPPLSTEANNESGDNLNATQRTRAPSSMSTQPAGGLNETGSLPRSFARAPTDITRPRDDDEAARRARQQAEYTAALEAQIQEREQARAAERRRRLEEDSADLQRLGQRGMSRMGTVPGSGSGEPKVAQLEPNAIPGRAASPPRLTTGLQQASHRSSPESAISAEHLHGIAQIAASSPLGSGRAALRLQQLARAGADSGGGDDASAAAVNVSELTSLMRELLEEQRSLRAALSTSPTHNSGSGFQPGEAASGPAAPASTSSGGNAGASSRPSGSSGNRRRAAPASAPAARHMLVQQAVQSATSGKAANPGAGTGRGRGGRGGTGAGADASLYEVPLGGVDHSEPTLHSGDRRQGRGSVPAGIGIGSIGRARSAGAVRLGSGSASGSGNAAADASSGAAPARLKQQPGFSFGAEADASRAAAEERRRIGEARMRAAAEQRRAAAHEKAQAALLQQQQQQAILRPASFLPPIAAPQHTIQPAFMKAAGKGSESLAPASALSRTVTASHNQGDGSRNRNPAQHMTSGDGSATSRAEGSTGELVAESTFLPFGGLDVVPGPGGVSMSRIPVHGSRLHTLPALVADPRPKLQQHTGHGGLLPAWSADAGAAGSPSSGSGLATPQLPTSSSFLPAESVKRRA